MNSNGVSGRSGRVELQRSSAACFVLPDWSPETHRAATRRGQDSARIIHLVSECRFEYTVLGGILSVSVSVNDAGTCDLPQGYFKVVGFCSLKKHNWK